ncbi:branched-chain amino acid ABC transporter permease [Nitriliruptor alkaliphilus]|uniref:branched-chain amino acid ABC transporter permease n=1 Tax=Nitriliruptor alkaliphilus TaxID=427918 RepID=UPI0006961BBB|nr:branched-chain amino acid ABC transporter permease [Nitriliruptor alkaliphilus]
MLAHILVYGAVSTSTILLISLGFSLTFGLTGVANFAHAAFYLASGYVLWLLLNSVGLPYAVAVVVTIALLALAGALLYRVVIAPVRGIVLSEVIATFALGIAILEFFRYLGFVTYEYRLPVFHRGQIAVLGRPIDYQRISIVVVAVLVTVGLWWFTQRTNTGRALRAVSQDEQTALTLGIRSEWAATVSVALSGALAAVAAITILPLGVMSINTGYTAILIALAATVLGGIESLWGLVAGSAILGFTQTTTGVYLGEEWAVMVYLVAIVFMLAWRPSGLFGRTHLLEERV